MKTNIKIWRESVSLIIAAQNGSKNSSLYDYNLLFLKRHKNTKFPGNFVFPGGLIESADADLRWVDFFKSHTCNNDNNFKSLIPNSKNRPQMFESKKNEIPREISLRISAIRETFEECGILLCKRFSEHPSTNGDSYQFESSSDLNFWQEKVHCDANEFFNMCIKLECYPNLWALYEWRIWLTPTIFPTSQRFSTLFFFTYLSQIPELKLDSSEIEDILWSNPKDMLVSFQDFLLPPQQYEITRIGKFKKFNDLIEFTLQNPKNNLQQYMSIAVNLLDGTILLLPGDSTYPNDVDLKKIDLLDKSIFTIKQFRDLSANLNRIEIFHDTKIRNIITSKL